VSRVVSVRLSDADDARIKGAAAVTGLSVSAYLKWLVTNGKIGTQSDTEMLLRRFDDLAAAIANFGAAKGEDRIVTLADLPARDALVRQLRDRGVPSSTIRQVEAALDELEQEAARARGRVNTNVNTENHA
jgi:mobilization protein NikA